MMFNEICERKDHMWGLLKAMILRKNKNKDSAWQPEPINTKT